MAPTTFSASPDDDKPKGEIVIRRVTSPLPEPTTPPIERDVIIKPTKVYGGESIDYVHPLIVVSNSFNGTGMRIGNNVRLFSVGHGPSKDIFTGLWPFKHHAVVHQFAVLSQDFPYSLFLDNATKPSSWDLEALINPDLILEGAFDFTYKSDSKESYRDLASQVINKKVHQVARRYAEDFAVRSKAFNRIVDEVAQSTYGVEETRAYQMEKAFLNSRLMPTTS